MTLKCRTLQPGTFKLSTNGYKAATGTDALADELASVGPPSVIMESFLWNTYVSGVMTDCGDPYFTSGA